MEHRADGRNQGGAFRKNTKGDSERKSQDRENLIEQALEDGIDADTIVNESLLKAMDVIAESFSSDIAFVPDMILASRAIERSHRSAGRLYGKTGGESPLGQWLRPLSGEIFMISG